MSGRRRTLLWGLYTPLVAIVAISLAAATAYTSRTVRNFYLEKTAGDLEARAHLAARLVADEPLHSQYAELDASVKELGRRSETRITIISREGRVIADSDEDPAVMDNHANRPEIRDAIEGRTGQSTRYSQTVDQNMMYIALPGDPSGIVVRTSIPLVSIEAALTEIYLQVAIGGLTFATLATGVILLMWRRVSDPLERLQEAAQRFTAGDLRTRFDPAGIVEVDALAEAMNQMARELAGRIETVNHQRTEQEAVLSSMVEGVMAVDPQERVITLNTAAAKLLNVDAEVSIGRSVQEVTRTPELQRFVKRALKSEVPVETELTLYGPADRDLQAHGAPIVTHDQKRIGAVVVLNDLTRLRRLEAVRRDFVANVSHELRTPITSIKGFIETLAEGALEEPDTAKRFLDIASRQADRLNAIIEDLLTLSSLEQSPEGGRAIAREQRAIRPLISSAIDACSKNAGDRSIHLEIDCSEDLEADINAPLLEQALVNLVDNAIKYSDEGGNVRVSAEAANGSLEISVEDDGCGIDSQHQKRLFERFYRVDKARSRKLGGTGLGLAIVKHIAQAHDGSVGVESSPGEGSTFTIVVPDDSGSNRPLTPA